MATTRLQDDLLREFREQKRMVQQQLNDFEPLVASLRKPAARRLTNKGLIIVAELICWLLFLAAVGACIYFPRLIPYHELFKEASWNISKEDQKIIQYSVYGILGLTALLFVLLARALAGIRQKNDVLQKAGTRIKTLVGQHLQRRAAIDAIEQRHFNELPVGYTTNVNAIPNPGYDENEGIVQKIP